MKSYDLGTPETAWWLPQIEERGAVLLIDGIIRPNRWPPAEQLNLAADGKIVPGIDYLEMTGNAIGVRGMVPIPAVFGERSEIVLRLARETGQSLRDWDQFHIARPGMPSPIPLPPAKLTNRAIWQSPRVFDKWGYALKRKIDEALAPHLPAPMSSLRLLDWGCGCGRLAKYFAGECAYTGIDIDAEAIAWCRANIPGATFELQNLEPRTKFARDSFDLATGISIFTHLREEDQFSWLEELSRVVKHGGIVAVSVNGPTSLFNANYPSSVQDTLKTQGFCDTGVEDTLKGVTSDDSYYRNVYHTHDYIRERWSQWFEVLAVLPAFVSNMQDMILLRPRP